MKKGSPRKIDPATHKVTILTVEACDISRHLIHKISHFLSVNGYALTEDVKGSDTIIINTCCFTEPFRQVSEDMIAEAVRHIDSKRVVVFGCIAKIPNKFSALRSVIQIGPKECEKIDGLFPHTTPFAVSSREYADTPIYDSYHGGFAAADLPILICQGCDNDCSYCRIKRAKGYVSSRSVRDIVCEARKGFSPAHRCIILIGDNCTSYGVDIGASLEGLVDELLAAVMGAQLKITSLFPAQFIRIYPRLRAALKTGRIDFLEIPFQSGSNRLLGLMNRDYDIDRFAEVLKDLRKISPRTYLFSHILVDFPGETLEDFQKTVRVARLFDETAVFVYSQVQSPARFEGMSRWTGADHRKRMGILEGLIAKGRKFVIVPSSSETLTGGVLGRTRAQAAPARWEARARPVNNGRTGSGPA